MTGKNKKLKEKAIFAFSKDFPNSIVSDLVLCFEKKTVILFLELFSGQQISIPSIKSIWTSYRNRTIKETLDEENSAIRRKKLAAIFGTDSKRISEIYSHISKRGITRTKHRTLKRTVEIIFRKNVRKYQKLLRDLEMRPYNGLQNPEKIFLAQELAEDFIHYCRKDLEEYLIFSGREAQQDKVLQLLYDKIVKELGNDFFAR